MSSIQGKRCNDCNQIYDTRDRLCPICGAAFSNPVAPASAHAPLLRLQSEQANEPSSPHAFQGEVATHLAERLRVLLLQGGWIGESDAFGGDIDLERLLSRRDGLGGGNGLSEEDIDRLPRSQLHSTSSMLISVTLTLESDEVESDITMECIPGSFSPIPPDGALIDLVPTVPLTADVLPLRHRSTYRDKVLVMQRGKQTFGAMLRAAREVEARGVVVVNSLPLWPYLMRDGRGEARLVEHLSARGGEQKAASCFIVMVSQGHGQELLRRLGAGRATEETPGKPLAARLAASRVERECLICICSFAEGETILRLPCQHSYHADCARKWLALQKTCPACRTQIKTRRNS